MHMLGENTEVVKRWSSEIQEVVQSKHGMVQFHAVSLLHALRAKDRLAVSKLVSTLVKGNIRSPLAQCMLVRYVARVRVSELQVPFYGHACIQSQTLDKPDMLQTGIL